MVRWLATKHSTIVLYLINLDIAIFFQIHKVHIILTEFTRIQRSRLRNALCYVCSNYVRIQND